MNDILNVSEIKKKLGYLFFIEFIKQQDNKHKTTMKNHIQFEIFISFLYIRNPLSQGYH